MKKLSILTLVAALAAGFAAPAWAQGEPGETVAAIGRLNHAGHRNRMHCTASLIGANRALTAAHCIKEHDVTQMHFLPNYDRGIWFEELIPTSAVATDYPRDVATLCLTPEAGEKPLSLASDAPKAGEAVTVVGYPTPRAHAQSRIACQIHDIRMPGAFTLTCPLSPGASGAPVLRETAEGMEIVGVVSATSTEKSLAFDVTGDHAPATCP